MKFSEIRKLVDDACSNADKPVSIYGESESDCVTLISGKVAAISIRNNKSNKVKDYKSYKCNTNASSKLGVKSAKISLLSKSDNTLPIFKANLSVFWPILVNVLFVVYLIMIPNAYRFLPSHSLYVLNILFVLLHNSVIIRQQRVHSAEHMCINTVNDLFKSIENLKSRKITVTKNKLHSMVNNASRLSICCGTLYSPFNSILTFALSSILIYFTITYNLSNKFILTLASILILIICNYVTNLVAKLCRKYRLKLLRCRVYRGWVKFLLYVQYLTFTRKPEDSDIQLAENAMYTLLGIPTNKTNDLNVKYDLTYKKI